MMRMVGTMTAVAMSAVAAHWPAEPQAADLMALGRHLAQECTSCHRLDGVDNGIPSIAGHNAKYLIATLALYKSGERKNATMVSVAQSLDDEQIKALALYWSSVPQPRPAPAKSASPAKSKADHKP